MTIEFTSEQYEFVKALICPMCKYKIPESGGSEGWRHSLAKTPLQRVTCLANDFRVEFHGFGGGVIRSAGTEAAIPDQQINPSR